MSIIKLKPVTTRTLLSAAAVFLALWSTAARAEEDGGAAFIEDIWNYDPSYMKMEADRITKALQSQGYSDVTLEPSRSGLTGQALKDGKQVRVHYDERHGLHIQ